MLRSKTCRIEGCNNPVWAKGVCQKHTPKIRLKVKRDYSLTLSREGHEALDKALKAQMMHEFFVSIWKKRPHRSEVSGISLGKEPLSTYFHHILPKSKYKDAAFDKENIILLTPDEHNNVENDMYKYEEVNIRREKLKLKYKL